MTRRGDILQHIAIWIYETTSDGELPPRDYIEKKNDGEGFTVSLPAALGNTLRVEGIHLTADELERVYSTAADYLRETQRSMSVAASE